jgi:phage/plasmid-associated DNA primase
LLSISGEDTLTVNVKYKEQWNGKLSCRLHVISNELPKLADASAAIIGRIVLLPLSRSWLGKENYELETELRSELTGILNWALAGLERLTFANKNKFTKIAAADEGIITMRDLASPVGAFVREKCVIGAQQSVEVTRLYDAFKNWCEASEHPKSSKHVFGRDLRAAQFSSPSAVRNTSPVCGNNPCKFARVIAAFRNGCTKSAVSRGISEVHSEGRPDYETPRKRPRLCYRARLVHVVFRRAAIG